MPEVAGAAWLGPFSRGHPKAFVVYTRRGSPVHNEVASFARQLQDANPSVEVAECYTDFLSRTGFARSVQVVPTFAAYRDGAEERLVEGLAVKRAAAACEALELVD